jgi:hypothetical protein
MEFEGLKFSYDRLLGQFTLLNTQRTCLMKFLVQWTLPAATYRPAVARFLEGGGMPPQGVKLIGRWHGMSGGGCAIAETNDAKALYTWVAEWSEFLPMTTPPVLEDKDAGKILEKMYG